MTIALTGASGFVGAVIAGALPADRAAVRLLRRPGRASDIAWSLERRDAGVADLLAERGVTDLVHAAWDMTASSPAVVERVCVAGSLALLAAAREAGVDRFVFVSTISAFDGARSAYGRAKREVERAVLAEGGIVLRLGLVHDPAASNDGGGMFGTLRRNVSASRIVPLIGGGTASQHLLDAGRLRVAIARCLSGDLDGCQRPVTLADEHPVPLATIVRGIARDQGRGVLLVAVPWRPVYAALRGLEALGLTPSVRSDSVLSLVHRSPSPDFTEARRLGL